MKIYNTQTYNYQTKNNKQSQPSFNAKIKLNPDTKLLHDVDKLELDGGLLGFLRGKPFKSAIRKLTEMYPDQTVEFTYKPPVFYGFNYVTGNGMAQGHAKICATNIDTCKQAHINIDDYTAHPFYELVSALVDKPHFWSV
jgi:hypothetical protein